MVPMLMKVTEYISMGQSDETLEMFKCAKDCLFQETVGYSMRQILSGVTRQLEEQFAHLGLKNAQWLPLLILYFGQVSTAAELARVCQRNTGAISRTLARLEAKGFCSRMRLDTNRRKVRITLTDVGRKAAAEIPAILCSIEKANLRGFSVEELETLKFFLRRILENSQMINPRPLSRPKV